MPKLGLSMEHGTITKWYKAEGEAVKAGENLFEVETEKLSNDIACDTDGILRKILVAEGECADCIAPVAIVAQAGEDISQLP